MNSFDDVERVTVVPELLRASNGAGDQSGSAIRQLLHRAVVEIRGLRELVGIPGSGTSSDAVIGIVDVAARIGSASDEDVRGAMLEAAEMIRTLRVISASGVEIKLTIVEPDTRMQSN